MKLIVSNWKMHGTLDKFNEYFETFLMNFKKTENRVIFSIPYVFLRGAVKITGGYGLEIFAQNCHFEDEGAFTGEVSVKMLSSIGVKGSIVGHSERKQFGETFESINKKIKVLIENNLTPIICVGEGGDEKFNKKHVLEDQLCKSLNEINKNSEIIIAYEPIYAIGNGRSVNIGDIRSAINIIRSKCINLNLSNVKIIYGGSVNRGNVRDLLSHDEIDGVLIGGASLDPNFISEIS